MLVGRLFHARVIVKIKVVQFLEHIVHLAVMSTSVLFQLRWLHVAATDLSQTLNFDVAVAYYSLAFGISTEQLLAGRNSTTSSGIMWTECIYRAHDGEYTC